MQEIAEKRIVQKEGDAYAFGVVWAYGPDYYRRFFPQEEVVGLPARLTNPLSSNKRHGHRDILPDTTSHYLGPIEGTVQGRGPRTRQCC